jgi:hypothetical protein
VEVYCDKGLTCVSSQQVVHLCNLKGIFELFSPLQKLGILSNKSYALYSNSKFIQNHRAGALPAYNILISLFSFTVFMHLVLLLSCLVLGIFTYPTWTSQTNKNIFPYLKMEAEPAPKMPCLITKIDNGHSSHIKIQQDATVYQNFIIPYLYKVRHVSGDTPPIIRSLQLH